MTDVAPTFRILRGSARKTLRTLPDSSVHAVITSPPYWSVRDYEVKGQYGLEENVACTDWFTKPGSCKKCWVCKQVLVFREIRRVLHPRGTLWINQGDCYYSSRSFAGPGKGTDGVFNRRHIRAGKAVGKKLPLHEWLKPKDLVLQPMLLCLALQKDGWWVRNDNIWGKPNPMPDSAPDRCGRSHEYMLELAKTAQSPEDLRVALVESLARTFERNLDKIDAAFSKSPKKFQSSLLDAKNRHGYFLHLSKAPKQYHHDRAAAGRPWESGRDDMRTKGIRTGRAYVNQKGVQKNDGEVNESAKKEGQEAPLLKNMRTIWGIPAGKSYRDETGKKHFATFPRDLVRPAILLATSGKGCCPRCLFPWKRLRAKSTGGSSGKAWHDHKADTTQGNVKHRSSAGYRPGVTLGWAPTCKCVGKKGKPLKPIPCTVLDPYSGMGTTGAVSLELMRNYIGIELKDEYADVSERRLSRITPGQPEVSVKSKNGKKIETSKVEKINGSNGTVQAPAHAKKRVRFEIVKTRLRDAEVLEAEVVK